jgi:hypothetical protein
VERGLDRDDLLFQAPEEEAAAGAGAAVALRLESAGTAGIGG